MDALMLTEAIMQRVPAARPREKADRPAVTIPVGEFLPLMQMLRDDPQFAFDMLLSHTAIDWLEQGEFELVYLLYSTELGHHLMVSCRIPREQPVIHTVSALWAIAEWQEREAFDLFGILYDNHPDLRRLFLEDDWEGFPLRKDYEDAHMLRLPK